MLTAPLNLGKVNTTELFDYLYSFFHRDFIASRTYLNGSIYIDPRSYRKEDGKEMDFWHLTHKNQSFPVKQGNRWIRQTERLYDPDRSRRIEWVKQIITQHNHDKVKRFYHRESNRKRDIRLYLWAHEDDFVVILQKLGRSSSFLVTSFYIDYGKKRSDYESRYQNYISGRDADLGGCEWF